MASERSARSALIAGFCTLLPTVSSLAQESSNDSTTAGVTEEILVSARRREENLQVVPVAATTFSAAELQERMTFDVDEIGEFVPNVTLTTAQSDNISEVVVRGIGGGSSNPRATAGSAVYIDGVYIPVGFGPFMSTLDVERIEVLRGPQGTMFGRNATGGALNVITRRPTSAFGGSATIRVGELGQRDVRGSLNAPLIDEKLFIRAALASEQDDGYYTEVTTGEGYNNKDRQELYLSARWIANERWTVDVSGQHSDRSGNGRGGNCNFIRRTLLNGRLHESGGGGDYETACNASRDAGPYAFISDVDGSFDSASTRFFATANWDAGGPIGRLGNASARIGIAALEETRRGFSDRDYSAERLFALGSFIYPSGEQLGRQREARNFEAIFQGTAFAGRLDFLVGYNYFRDEGSPEGDDCFALYETVAGSGDSVVCSRPGGFHLELIPLNIIGIVETHRAEQEFADNVARALFFHTTYDLAENLFVDFGGRWSSEKRWFKALEWGPLNAPLGRENLIHEINDDDVSIFEQDQGEWNVFTPTVSLSRRISGSALEALDEGIIYASYAEGFNSGGFNFGIPQDVLGAFYSYDPEEVTAYELGFKSTWLNGNLRLNIASFLTDYSNKQVEVIVENGDALFGIPDLTFTDNVAEVEIRGLEIETELRTNSGFVFQAAASYLKNEFSEYRSFDPDQGLNLDLSEQIIPDLTPDYTLNAAVQYTFNLVSGASLTPRLGVYWQDDYDYAGGFENAPQSLCNQEAYSKFNARLTWSSNDGSLQLALFGTNISDELILHTCIESGITGRRIQYKPPERWGIEFSQLF